MNENPMDRLGTYLRWCLEHFVTYEATRNADPVAAEAELKYLKDSIDNAYSYYLLAKDGLDEQPLPDPG